MKNLFTSIALVCAFLFTAMSVDAQGVYIYKDGKKQVFQVEEIDSLVFFTTDDSTSPTVDNIKFEMPSINFGDDIDAIMSQEQGRGFNVTKQDTTKLTLTKTADGIDYSWVYNFDYNHTYKYAKCQLGADKVDAFKAFLRNTGYALQPDASQNAEVLVYVNTGAKTVVFINKEGGDIEFYLGAYDEASTSWTRISSLKDDSTSTWIPFYGKYATVELMQLFEKRMSHKFNVGESKVDKGIYVYDTGDVKWYGVKYWFDVKTRSKLEEASIMVNKDSIPTPSQVTAYLETMGYRYTSLIDNEGYVIYYNDTVKSACYVLMADNTKGQGTFIPQMHYAYSNLDGKIPPLTVDFPMPILEFGQKTLEEIMEEYKALPYYQSDETSEFGPIINTTSKDFPKIILMEDGGKYCATIVITFDPLAVRSPYITDMLKANGYEYYSGSIMPTFINTDIDVMAQFDLNDMFQVGWYSVSFMPNEFK